MTDEELIARLREIQGQAGLFASEAADRIEQLVKDKRWIMEERDRTFALMLARAEAAEAQIEALTAQVERLTGALRKAEQDFYEAANRFQDEDYEGPHEKFTVNVVCHIKPYFDMNMKHLRDSAAAARATLSTTTEEGHE